MKKIRHNLVECNNVLTNFQKQIILMALLSAIS